MSSDGLIRRRTTKTMTKTMRVIRPARRERSLRFLRISRLSSSTLLKARSGGSSRLDGLELALDVGGDAQGVRPALLGDRQADRGLPVDAVDLADLGVGHLDPGHVLDQDGVLAGMGDDGLPELVEAVDAVGELEQELLVAAPDPPRRVGPEPGADGRVDGVGVEAEGLDPVLVEGDPDLGLGASRDLDVRDAPDRAQADLELLLDQLLELLEAVAARDRVGQERPDAEIVRDVRLDEGPDPRRQERAGLGQLLAQGQLSRTPCSSWDRTPG